MQLRKSVPTSITRRESDRPKPRGCRWTGGEGLLRREESRGAHYRIDFPESRRQWRRRQLFVVRPRPLLGTHVIGEARRAGMEVLS